MVLFWFSGKNPTRMEPTPANAINVNPIMAARRRVHEGSGR